ncbi:MAG: dienelactone hydrolase family protein [Pirellulaceae bacterium]
MTNWNVLPMVLIIFVSDFFSLTALPSVLADEIKPVMTKPLDLTGEIDRTLIQGVDRFLLQQIRRSAEDRQTAWSFDPSSADAWEASLAANRQQLKMILGMRDDRATNRGFQFENLFASPSNRYPDSPTLRSSLIAETDEFEIHTVRWNAFGNVVAEGLLLEPIQQPAVANVIAIPHADHSPEQLCGLVDGVPAVSRFPIKLVQAGCRVVIPVTVSRQRKQFSWNGHEPDLTNREFLYRSAFELGRHLIGYELHATLAAVDIFQQQTPDLPVAVAGWGDGGMLALYAGAVDSRVSAVWCSGYFDQRETMWREPIDRNVFGRLTRFGDAELAAMCANRLLIIESADGPVQTSTGGPGAPFELTSPQRETVSAEFKRAQRCAGSLAENLHLIASDDGQFGGNQSLETLLTSLKLSNRIGDKDQPLAVKFIPDADQRMHRYMIQLDAHSQNVLRHSSFERKAFMQDLDTSSVNAFVESSRHYRDEFYQQVIGKFDLPLLPPNARTRLWKKNESWTGYEVVMDVFPDVIAHGILLIPNDMQPSEKRPVVVCQHGLEGLAQDTIEPLDHYAYKGFASRLASEGFITFAPQNLYRHQDDFRTLQRKANSIGKTLFSVITPQHQQIIHWLKTQPYVDGDRIAFYGLSYGGKTAMRVPAIVTDYCLSICSADFNEWVDKNASTVNPRSYVWTGEYEIFEFNLGGTFNYAEMASLIAPRPFMVERGHFDGVADDETVAFEFAKVRRLYQGQLKLADRCEIEWFAGPHTIHGKGTFDFLRRHLQFQP